MSEHDLKDFRMHRIKKMSEYDLKDFKMNRISIQIYTIHYHFSNPVHQVIY